MNKISIRVATSQDVAALWQIYAPYVKKTAITFEYEAPSLEEFTEKINHILEKDCMLFHEKSGYRMVGEFRKCGYKFNRWYNMVWMEKHIGKHMEEQPQIIWFQEIREGLSL